MLACVRSLGFTICTVLHNCNGSPRPHFNIYFILSTYARVYISLLGLCNPPTTPTVCSLASAMYSYHAIVRLCNIYIVRQGGPQPIYTTEVLTYLPYIEAMDRLYCTIYNILYSECATETNFPQQYQDQTSAKMTAFAFGKRLPYVTATGNSTICIQ